MTNGELRGVIHGRTIVLDEEPGLPDGATVAVRVSESDAELTEAERAERLNRAAGAWAGDDDEGFQEFLRWTYEQRDRGGRPPIED